MEIFTLENKIGKQGTIPKNFGQVVSLHFCRSILTYGRQKVYFFFLFNHEMIKEKIKPWHVSARVGPCYMFDLYQYQNKILKNCCASKYT